MYDFTDPKTNISNNIFFADTCFVWEMYGADMSQKQRDCKNFTNNAVQNGSVFVISPKVEEELRNVAVKEKLAVESIKLGLREYERKKIITNTPNFMQEVHIQVDEIMKIIDNNYSFIRLEQDAKLSLAWEISRQNNIDLSDSIILATMQDSEICNIVTLDKDYTKVKSMNLEVYTHKDNFKKLGKLYTD